MLHGVGLITTTLYNNSSEAGNFTLEKFQWYFHTPRKPDKNSVNSSTPPCKEKMKDEIARRTRTLRKPSVKKAGGQQGHDGHKLYPSSIPDEVADDAADYCTECGEPPADAERVLDHVTQVISIPELKRWSRKSGTMSWCARTAVNMCVRHRDGVRTTLCTTPA